MKFIKAFLILLKSFIFRKDLYRVHFVKIDESWYCDLPHWPKALSDKARMEEKAGWLLETMADGKDSLTVEFGFEESKLPLPGNHYNKARLTDVEMSRGACYDISALNFLSNIWVTSFTLYVFGHYPEYVYFRPI